MPSLVPHSPRDTTPSEIVGRELDRDPVSGHDLDKVHAHLAGKVRQDLVSIGQFDQKHRVREGILNGSLHGDDLFFSHKLYPLLSRALDLGKNVRTVVCDRHGVLKMSGKGTVLRDNGPAVGESLCLVTPKIEHRLDSKRHARLERRALTRLAKIRHLGVFMHCPANSVADILAHKPVAVFLREQLDGIGDVAEMPARDDLPNARGQSRLGVRQQSFSLGADNAHAYGDRRVALVALVDDTEIDADDVAFLQHALARNAMHDLLIDRKADGRRIVAIALERRYPLLLA